MTTPHNSWPGDSSGRSLLRAIRSFSNDGSQQAVAQQADQQPGPDEPPRKRVWVAVYAKLILHCLCFLSNVATLVIYAVFKQGLFFFPLMVVWLLCGVLCAWAALKELQPRYRGPCCQRWMWAVFALGFFRGLQIRHICRGPSSRPSAFHSKTFDGIFEGFFFALANQYAFFLLGVRSCPWYLTHAFTANCEGCVNLRFIFLASALFSMLSLATAVLEVDYRASLLMQTRINGPARGLGTLHFVYRASEVVFRLSLINLFSLFLRPLIDVGSLTLDSLLLYTPMLFIFLCYTATLHFTTKMAGADSEFWGAHAAVALALLSVNAVQFVDRDVYVREARQTSRVIFKFRLVEFVAVVVFTSCVAGKPVCNQNPASIWHQIVHSSQALATAELVIAVVSYTVLSIFVGYIRRSVFGLSIDRVDEGLAALRLKEGSDLGASVQRTVPHGLSSFLVHAATGVTHRLFASKEDEITDFAFEMVLGEGAFGVVALARSKTSNGHLLSNHQQRFFAVKLVVLAGIMQEVSARREREYLVKLAGLRHPFIMRLERFFDVGGMEFKDASGAWIENRHHARLFDKALMMEYCPLGDYESWLRRSNRALVAPSEDELPAEGSETLQASLEWLVRGRRLAAEMVDAVDFLHLNKFTHRDLKPGNILLKVGPDGQMHVCVTDFGFAKEGTDMDTYGGSHPYIAPEVRDGHYTPAVDLFSLGKVILLSLWGTKFELPSGSQQLQVPKKPWYQWGHLRVPSEAGSLVETMMKTNPADRGLASDLLRHKFFGDLLWEQRLQLPRVDWEALRLCRWVRDEDAATLTPSLSLLRSHSAER